MLCPILHHKDHNPDIYPQENFPDCLTEECAWWDTIHGQCSIRTLALAIERLAAGALRGGPGDET